MGVYLCWYAGRLLPQGILQVTCAYRLEGSSAQRGYEANLKALQTDGDMLKATLELLT